MRMRAFPVVTKNGLLESGMSLRDYFAAKAMQSLIINEEVLKESTEQNVDLPKLVAYMAYDMADEMMKAREEDD